MILAIIIAAIIIILLVYCYIDSKELKEQNDNMNPALKAQMMAALQIEREEVARKRSIKTITINKKTIRTDGMYIAMPSAIGKAAEEMNLSFGLIFNTKGLVYRSMGDFDDILKNKKSYVNEFQNYNDTKTSDSKALFKITNDKIQWKFYNPDSEVNQIDDEPLDYSEYLGSLADNDIKLSSQISYYDQELMKFVKKQSYKNTLFKFYPTT
jgi:hypothetical protein